MPDDESPLETEHEPESDDGGEGGRWPIDRLKPIVEAMIFAVADPLPTRRICDALDGATAAEVRAAALALQTDYASRGVRLVEVAGGWQFRTAPEHHTPVRQLFKDKPARLTRAAIETVAIVAYKQPATRADIESVRGVDSAAVLETLVERKVIKIAGRRDVPGRPLVYTTTPYFLELFGLKDLKALPTLAELGDEIGNLVAAAEFTKNEEADAAVLPLEDEDPGDATVPKVRFQAADTEGDEGAGDNEAADPRPRQG